MASASRRSFLSVVGSPAPQAQPELAPIHLKEPFFGRTHVSGGASSINLGVWPMADNKYAFGVVDCCYETGFGALTWVRIYQCAIFDTANQALLAMREHGPKSEGLIRRDLLKERAFNETQIPDDQHPARIFEAKRTRATEETAEIAIDLSGLPFALPPTPANYHAKATAPAPALRFTVVGG